MQDHVYLARQPIVDNQQKIVGYELLFRRSAEATHASFTDDHLATSKVLANILSNMGAEWLLGDKLAFVNASTSMLMSDFLELLPVNRAVLEVLETTHATPELLARCHELRTLGYRLALDDFELTPESAPLLAIANFIKLDVQKLNSKGQLEAHVRALEKHPAQLIAEKVETKSEHNNCKKLGFAYYQGYYFAHPETLSAKVIHPAYAVVLELLNKVRNNAEIKDIESSFKRDVALSFKLLRYINSVGFGLSCEIQSLRHALAILGYQQLYRWLTLLLVTAGEGSTSPALMKTAVTRGRLTELLGKDMLEAADRDNLFIVGVFSLLDAMLEMPMEEVLDKLSLPETISDALLTRQGLYGPFLDLAVACEEGDTDHIEKLAFSLQLEPDKINQAHLSALAWVETLGI
ncbi:diguanylate phosphodiesterase [Sulfuricella sp. T08]|uniref:EAL and HDOD domain-containing protein n=1 Tax=Sulfuricella sp. T08 TaxID=1632857 RepID=UPI000617966B|nr:EAL domain-containing protein [Sulfuricella sp. T08]GAO37468.1 diguanylate phosphodiesterase [Sulfuricella sp. T08]